MTMGYYLASVATLGMIFFVPWSIIAASRDLRSVDKDERRLAIGVIAFTILGAALILPLFWMMAAHEPL
jgi:hypothetical protein